MITGISQSNNELSMQLHLIYAITFDLGSQVYLANYNKVALIFFLLCRHKYPVTTRQL